MKFLTDAGVGKKVEDVLRANTHDVKSILDTNPQASDVLILHTAVFEERIVVTMDKDFGELVFNSNLNHKGVLLLRLGEMNGNQKAEVMSYILENYSDKIQNNFSVFKNGTLRTRKG